MNYKIFFGETRFVNTQKSVIEVNKILNRFISENHNDLILEGASKTKIFLRSRKSDRSMVSRPPKYTISIQLVNQKNIRKLKIRTDGSFGSRNISMILMVGPLFFISLNAVLRLEVLAKEDVVFYIAFTFLYIAAAYFFAYLNRKDRELANQIVEKLINQI